MSNITWDDEGWLRRFTTPNPNYRGLRREVWENTKAVVESGSYTINSGRVVTLPGNESRRNPGGGVHSESGAQKEYLFRCSDYYKFMYCFAEYAEQYDLKHSPQQYPLDRNHGGIYSPGVTIFRDNESRGYALASSVWRVNMIAVAGMNSPHLVSVDSEERIHPELVEGVKNKIRTIFRIACAHGQRNLVLGALGCGCVP